MRLFEYLFGPTNPTKDWQAVHNLRLEFDLEHGSLNGVRVTEPLEKLSFLGPDEGVAGGEFRYYSLGLSIGCYSHAFTVESFELIQNDPLSTKYLPYSGLCRYRDKTVRLNTTTERSFQSDFGSPYWRDEDEKEIILFYEFPNMEWQLEFSLEGGLNRIIVNATPLLAEEQQRLAYGVTRPWPPGA